MNDGKCAFTPFLFYLSAPELVRQPYTCTDKTLRVKEFARCFPLYCTVFLNTLLILNSRKNLANSPYTFDLYRA